MRADSALLPRAYAAITTSIFTPNSTGQRCAYRAPATMVKAGSLRAGLFPFCAGFSTNVLVQLRGLMSTPPRTHTTASNPAPATNDVGHLVIALSALLFGSVPRGCHEALRRSANRGLSDARITGKRWFFDLEYAVRTRLASRRIKARWKSSCRFRRRLPSHRRTCLLELERFHGPELPRHVAVPRLPHRHLPRVQVPQAERGRAEPRHR